jgi:Trypsin-like peptidase domain
MRANTTTAVPTHTYEQKKILGKDQREAALAVRQSDPVKYAHGQAVGQITVWKKVGSDTKPSMSWGTAWRVGSENRFITNHHVLPEDFHKLEMTFGSEFPAGSEPGRVSIKGGAVLATGSLDLDFTLFSVDEKAFSSGVLDRFGYLGLDVSKPRVDTEIYVPQHGNASVKDIAKPEYGRPKSFAIKDDSGKAARITKVVDKDGKVSHSADTARAASGSPLIDASTHKVVALHRAGGASGTEENIAVSMERIWPRISAFFSGVPEGSMSPGPRPQAVPAVPVVPVVSARPLLKPRPLPVAIPISEMPRPSSARPAPSTPGANAWQEGATYRKGDVVEYAGKSYRANWYARGGRPDRNAAFSEIAPAGTAGTPWNASQIYREGDRVSFGGATYEAKWWSRGASPEGNSNFRRVSA